VNGAAEMPFRANVSKRTGTLLANGHFFCPWSAALLAYNTAAMTSPRRALFRRVSNLPRTAARMRECEDCDQPKAARALRRAEVISQSPTPQPAWPELLSRKEERKKIWSRAFIHAATNAALGFHSTHSDSSMPTWRSPPQISTIPAKASG
jgi:hypothetical protein